MTAAVDGPNNRFSQQQSRGMNPNSAPFTPSFAQTTNVQAQALQMQMMQLEIMRIRVRLIFSPLFRHLMQFFSLGHSSAAVPGRAPRSSSASGPDPGSEQAHQFPTACHRWSSLYWF